MRERLTAVIAGASILTAGCSVEVSGHPTAISSQGELEIGADTAFLPEEHSNFSDARPLKLGERVVGICIEYTSEESATIATGFMRVRWRLQAGDVPTISRDSQDRAVDVFKGYTEEELAEAYPRCDVAGSGKEDDNARAA